MKPPTKHQLDLLRRAAGTGLGGDKQQGMMPAYGCATPTLDILVDSGWVAPGQFLRDAPKRALAEDVLERAITEALIHARNRAHQKCEATLRRARSALIDLAAGANWITPAGLQVLRDHGIDVQQDEAKETVA